MNIITSYDINEVYSRIKVKKPIKFNNKIILNIYDNIQENLFFQSPVMYLPYDYIYDENIIRCMDVCEYNDDKFINFITTLYKKIINKINVFNSALFQNKKFYSNIVLNKRDNNIKMFRFKQIYINKINVYDFRNNLINIKQIVKENKVKCIFMIKNIWINEDRYGFNLELLQIQNKDFINNSSLFKNSEILNNNFIYNDGITAPPPQPPPPPPPPPPPFSMKLTDKTKHNDIKEIIKQRKINNSNKIQENKFSMNDVLNELNSGKIKLKKTIINKKEKKEMKDLLMNEMALVLRRRIAFID